MYNKVFIDQIAKKRKGLTGAHDKQLQAFFNALATAFVRFVNFDIVKCVLIASPVSFELRLI